LVDPGVFFFKLGFRHPADFLGTPHPCRFFARGFFQLLFLFAWVCEAAAHEVVEPAKNIRPVMSAMKTRNILGIITLFRNPAPGGGRPLPGSRKDKFLSLT
jgi:hypothetical protein